jgi:hypothetical protein
VSDISSDRRSIDAEKEPDLPRAVKALDRARARETSVADAAIGASGTDDSSSQWERLGSALTAENSSRQL